jgi:excisionase family DNA binding protein
MPFASRNTLTLSISEPALTPDELPFLLTPKQLATLLNVTERTLERQRAEGSGAIPFVKNGRRVYYPRQHVCEYLGNRVFTNTAEAKRAARLRKAASATS